MQLRIQHHGGTVASGETCWNVICPGAWTLLSGNEKIEFPGGPIVFLNNLGSAWTDHWLFKVQPCLGTTTAIID